VHRDIKPSNLLLAQPFFVQRDLTKKKGVRSLSRAEICGAQWSCIDLGSAALLQRTWCWEWSLSRPWSLLPRLQWSVVSPSSVPPYETPAYSPPEVPVRKEWGVGGG